MKAELKRRILALQVPGSARGLCDCAEQLAAIGRAEVAIDDDGRCQYCGRPITADWPGLLADLQRVYGEG